MLGIAFNPPGKFLATVFVHLALAAQPNFPRPRIPPGQKCGRRPSIKSLSVGWWSGEKEIAWYVHVNAPLKSVGAFSGRIGMVSGLTTTTYHVVDNCRIFVRPSRR